MYLNRKYLTVALIILLMAIAAVIVWEQDTEEMRHQKIDSLQIGDRNC